MAPRMARKGSGSTAHQHCRSVQTNLNCQPFSTHPKSAQLIMRQADRVKLHFGPYKSPPFKMGQTVKCAVHGDVVVLGVTKGRIPWPFSRPRTLPLPVVCGGLLEAVRKESAVAVAHWWQVTEGVVHGWRKALGVGLTTGSKKLRAAGYADPKRSKKIAATKRGKPRPPEVKEKIRAAHKRRSQNPPAK